MADKKVDKKTEDAREDAAKKRLDMIKANSEKRGK
jgi:hypothetical protein